MKTEIKMLSQYDMVKQFLRWTDAVVIYPSKEPGTRVYKKSGKFEARLGTLGETITTTIDGEDETVNTVKADDVVMKGPKGELYIISNKTFNERYEVDMDLSHEFRKYNATGLIRAHKHTGPSFVFTASWVKI